MKKTKILISILNSSEYFHYRFMQSLHSLRYPKNSDITIQLLIGHQLPFARNRGVQKALSDNFDYIFWLDSDMIFPSDSLERLLQRKKDIIHALSFRRTAPHYPCLFEWREDLKSYETIDYSKKSDDLIECDAAGSACTLINTKVYKQLKAPYYYYRDNLFSSDLTFSENARKIGFVIYVDRTLKTGHIGNASVITEKEYLFSLSNESKKEWNANMQKHLTKEKENYKK